MVDYSTPRKRGKGFLALPSLVAVKLQKAHDPFDGDACVEGSAPRQHAGVPAFASPLASIRSRRTDAELPRQRSPASS